MLDVESILLDLLSSDPGSPTEGQVWYNTTEKRFKSYQAGQVQTVVAKSATTTTDPTVSDDSTQGYSIGSRWINTVTDDEWVCFSDAAGAAVWKSTVVAGSGITAATHKTLLQLIHFIDEGPAEGFTTGATKTTTGTVFPTQNLWKRADATKLVEQNITWTGVTPTTIQWKMYDTDGVTVLATVTDTITYSGVFEASRTRAIA